MDELRSPGDWYALGRAIYEDVLDALRRYGVVTHPDLRFVQAESPTPYYEPATLTIGFGIPDPATPRGRLYTYFVQHLVGAADLAETRRAMEVPLPWAMAHEVVHHLRHHYGAPIDNDFVEEQVVNCVAIALLEEHPRYRDGLPDLKRWADRVFAHSSELAPATSHYLAGFRLDVGDVLLARGEITARALAEARELAQLSGAAAEEILVRTGRVSAVQVTRARGEREETEAYFNRRYMAGLGEYWLFGTEWLARYLERDDRPSLGVALERYLLTADWETSRRDATRLFLEQALRSPDPAISTTAADALADLAGTDAISALVRVLDDPSPSVRATALWTLCRLPGGPQAGATRAIELLNGDDEVRGPAARLLRLAERRVAPAAGTTPAQVAEAALACLADEPATAHRLLGQLLDGDEPAVAAALDALGEAGPGPLLDRVIACLETGSAVVRAQAARALAGSPVAAEALTRRLDDDDPRVRRAARETLERLGRDAWPVLVAVAADRSDTLRVAALRTAARLGAPEASPLLADLATSLRRRARRLARVEGQLAGLSQLDVLIQAVGEERRRLARLSLRALGQIVDPIALDLAERALDSPDHSHHAAGRDLVRRALGRRGRAVAELLEQSVPETKTGDPAGALRACARAEPAVLRGLAAYFAPRVPAPGSARAILLRLGADPDPAVRAEAQSTRQTSPGSLETPMLTNVEKLLYLRAVPTFAGCEIDALRRFAEVFVVQRFETGEVIVREGEPGQHLYVLTEGRVEVTAGGRHLNDIGPRQYFGEMALFDGGPRSATATAVEATTLLRLDRDDFYRLGRESPDLLIGVIRVISERLRALMTRTQEPTSPPVST